MKSSKLTKKLFLKKETIAALGTAELKEVKGGATVSCTGLVACYNVTNHSCVGDTTGPIRVKSILDCE